MSNNDETASSHPAPLELTVARVRKTQGRKGEVAAEILTDFPDRFEVSRRVNVLQADGTGSIKVIESVWFHKGAVILKFSGIDSISEAERLVGAEIRIPRSEARTLPANSHYIFELVGCRVVENDSGREIGQVEELSTFGGNSLLHVKTGRGEVLLPFTEEICRSIDTRQRIIRVSLPEGLLELNP